MKHHTKDMNVYLNGHTVDTSATQGVAIDVTEGANVTINGTGNVIAKEGCVMTFQGSELVINGGTYTCTDNFVIGMNGSENQGGNTITINGMQICVRIFPYIKFSNWQKGTLWIEGRDLKQYDIDAWISFANDYVGRSKRSTNGSWGDISDCIAEKLQGRVFSEKEINEFREGFRLQFIESNRTTADKSCGFQVEAYIPYKEAQKLDTSESDTRIATLLHNYISEIQSYITTDRT